MKISTYGFYITICERRVNLQYMDCYTGRLSCTLCSSITSLYRTYYNIGCTAVTAKPRDDATRITRVVYGQHSLHLQNL